MCDDLALALPIGEINKRLTRNARERERLRTLLRVALEARDDAELAAQNASGTRHEAAGREGGHVS
jgi:hypothetical protein